MPIPKMINVAAADVDTVTGIQHRNEPKSRCRVSLLVELGRLNVVMFLQAKSTG